MRFILRRSAARLVLLTAMLVAGGSATATAAPTSVSGTIPIDTTWHNADGPILVTGDVVVAAGVTLTIEPGVEVRFSRMNNGGYYPHAELVVQGNVVADGTATEPITFTSAAASPQVGDWSAIRLDGALDRMLEQNMFDHVVFEYAAAALDVPFHAFEVTNSRFTENGNGLRASGTMPGYLWVRIDGTRFDHNESALSISAIRCVNACTQNFALTNNTVVENEEGIRLGLGVSDYEPVAVALSRNIVQNNAGTAISLAGGSFPMTLDANAVVGNGSGVITNFNPAAGFQAQHNSLYANSTSDWEAQAPGQGNFDLDVSDNWWGTTDAEEVNSNILDASDDFLRPAVLYDPLLSLPSMTAPAPDTVPPDAAIVAGPPSATQRRTADLSFTTSEPGPYAGFDCSLDGSTPVPCQSPVQLDALADGHHLYEVWARDAVGNVDPAPASVSWTVDNQIPTAFGLNSPSDEWLTSSPRPAFAWDAASDSGSGLDHYELLLDGSQVGSDVAAGMTTFTPSSDLSDGSHRWQVRAVDAAGNLGESESRGLTIDTAPPAAFALASPAAGAADLAPRPTFSWDSTTDTTTSIDRYELWIDGVKDRDVALSECVDGSCSAGPSVALAEGSHSWSVTAIDTAGNVRTSDLRGIGVDATAPLTFQLAAPADGANLNEVTPTLSWEATSDAGSGLDHYAVFVDGSRRGGQIPSAATSYTLSVALSEGPHDWRVDAIDQNGNTRSSASRALTIDTTAPGNFELGEPGAAALTRDSTPLLTWDAASDSPSGTGVGNYELWIDGSQVGSDIAAGTNTTTVATALSDGSHTWLIKAIDRAGNARSTASRILTVDATPPAAFGLTSPLDGAQHQPAGRSFSWASANDATSGVERYELWIDSAKDRDVAISACAAGSCSSRSLVLLGDGSHFWSVKAIDTAGNVRTSGSRGFDVDATAPLPFELEAPAAAAEVNDATPRFSWQPAIDAGSGLDHYALFVDGTQRGGQIAAATASATLSSNLSEGDHDWRVDAVDANGNTRSSATRALTIDAIAPDSRIDGGPVGSTRSGSATFAFSSTDSAAFECRLDAGPWTVCASPHALTQLGAGARSFQVRSIDAAGNIDATPAVRHWTIDHATLPDARLTLNASPALTGQAVTLDASTSSDPLDGHIESFAWDADGDGSFETEAGPAGRIERTYSASGQLAVGVRVTNTSGQQAVARAQLEVRPASPAGRLGVTINQGARYTNDASVTVSSTWPTLATTMLLSNDGGFGAPAQRALEPSVGWTLDSSGPERLPKTLYVRFEGGESGRETYQDDIILDDTPPQVTAAVVLSSPNGTASTAARSVRIRIKAKDRTSGVRLIQLARKKSTPNKARRFRRTIRASGHPRYVRVRDRAGNLSKWRKLRYK